MNMQIKPKTTPRGAKKQTKTTTKRVGLVYSKHLVLRHFRLVEHKHTAKLIHFKHTSHAALAGILVAIGFMLYISNNVAYSVTNGGSVNVSVIVPGPPPTIGAVITSPLDKDKFTDKQTLVVSGTCEVNTFVVIHDNDQLVGSDTCTAGGFFSLTIQVEAGKNVLSAMDYDNLNRPGPVTPTVTIFVLKSKPISPSAPVVSTTTIKTPTLPINPSIIPGVSSVMSSCEDYKAGSLPTSGEVHIAVVCIPRLFGSGVQQVLGILVWGGTPPYAISINWGNGIENTLLSITEPGYYKSSFSYAFPGIYRVDFLIKDKDGESAVVQSSVQVNGTTANPTTNNITQDGISWLKTPVPLYVMAVAITLGFWGGDIFTRTYSLGSYKQHGSRRTKRAA